MKTRSLVCVRSRSLAESFLDRMQARFEYQNFELSSHHDGYTYHTVTYIPAEYEDYIQDDINNYANTLRKQLAFDLHGLVEDLG